MVEVIQIIVTSFKRSNAGTSALSTLKHCNSPTVDTHLHQGLLNIHGQVGISCLGSHCSFILGPGAHNVLFVPSKSVSAVLCKF